MALMLFDFDLVDTITQADKDDFKLTFAGNGYVELLKIFQQAPNSEDKTQALKHLTNSFEAHLELWKAMVRTI